MKFQSIVEALNESETAAREAMTEVYQSVPHTALKLLREKKEITSHNCLMLAIIKNYQKVVLGILDYLNLCVYIHKLWSKADYAGYLSSTDNLSNNVLQLSLIASSSSHSQEVIVMVLDWIYRLGGSPTNLIANQNREMQNSIHLAIMLGYDYRVINQLFSFFQKDAIGDILKAIDDQSRTVVACALNIEKPIGKISIFLLSNLSNVSKNDFLSAVTTPDIIGQTALSLALQKDLEIKNLCSLFSKVLQHGYCEELFKIGQSTSIVDTIVEKDNVELMSTLLQSIDFKERIKTHFNPRDLYQKEFSIVCCDRFKYSPQMRKVLIEHGCLTCSHRYHVPDTSEIGTVCAIIVSSDENTHLDEALAVSKALAERGGIDVQSLGSTWTRKTLSNNIVSRIEVNRCACLIVYVSAHGYNKHILDPTIDFNNSSFEEKKAHSISISDLTEAIKDNTYPETPGVSVILLGHIAPYALRYN